MLVVSNTPPSLRGLISTYMVEVGYGVFVGTLSARVRDMLWDKVVSLKSMGSSTLVYSTNTEQRFNVVTHLSRWEAVDLDGLTVVERYDRNSSTRRGDRYLADDDDYLLNLEN